VSNVTVIVPARGGSTRIPRKNIVPFNGEPMISWPIRAALEAQGIDRVVVSSDDYEITQIALKTGAEAPFVRPVELATNHAGTAPVIVHAIDVLGLTEDHLVM
jgi:N-acylneuraminate cytidylyltransferase